MLRYIILKGLLVSLFCLAGANCFAQKAYELVIYKGKIPGAGTIQLDLADGYLPASKLTLTAAGKVLEFSPSTAAAESSGKWTFEPVLPGQQKQQMILFFNQTAESPDVRIPAEYIKGTKSSKFTLLRSFRERQ